MCVINLYIHPLQVATTNQSQLAHAMKSILLLVHVSSCGQSLLNLWQMFSSLHTKNLPSSCLFSADYFTFYFTEWSSYEKQSVETSLAF